jgi:hypothetical protein
MKLKSKTKQADHTIEQALEACYKGVRDGISSFLLKNALIIDGFTPEKADLIIRWAQQSKRNKNGIKSKATKPSV